MNQDEQDELHDEVRAGNEERVEQILRNFGLRWFAFGIAVGAVIAFLIVGYSRFL